MDNEESVQSPLQKVLVTENETEAKSRLHKIFNTLADINLGVCITAGVTVFDCAAADGLSFANPHTLNEVGATAIGVVLLSGLPVSLSLPFRR